MEPLMRLVVVVGLGLTWGRAAGAGPACFRPLAKKLLGGAAAPRPGETFAKQKKYYKSLPPKAVIRREERRETLQARNRYNQMLDLDITDMPPSWLEAKVSEAVGHFALVDPAFDSEGFLEWLREHHQPNPKLVKLGDWLRHAGEDYAHSEKATARLFNSKNWFRCVLTNPAARQSLMRDVVFSQSITALLFHDRFKPTLHEICVQHMDARNCVAVEPQVLEPAAADLCRAQLGPEKCALLKPATVQARFNEYLRERYLAVAEGPWQKKPPALISAGASSINLDAQRYPFDTTVNSILWALVLAEVNCRNLLRPDHKLGERIRTTPFSRAEQFERLGRNVARVSGIAFLSNSTFVGWGALEDSLRGKSVDLGQEYALKMPPLMLYSVWSTFKGTSFSEPIKLKAIPSAVTAIDDALARWSTTELRARLAGAALKVSDIGLSYGFRTFSSVWGNIEFQEVYRKAVMPQIEQSLKKAFAQFSASRPAAPAAQGAATQTIDSEGTRISFIRRPGGKVDIDIAPGSEALNLIDKRFDQLLLEKIAAKRAAAPNP